MAEYSSIILPRSEWLGAMYELSLHCADDQPSDARERARDFNALLVLAPDPLLIDGLQPINASRLDELLTVDAAETAVMAMFDQGAGYMLSRGGDGQSLATVALPSPQRERSGAGATPALALIGALALSLADTAVIGRVPMCKTTVERRAALH